MGPFRSSVLDSSTNKDDILNIVLLGEGSAGKTTMTVRVKEGRFIEQYDPTLYDVHKFKMSVDGQDEHVEIQDTAGQEVFYDSVIDEFIRKANGIVFMYQITSQHSLQELEEKYIQKVRLIKKDMFHAVIVGNKKDLESYREVSFEEGKQVADKYNIPFYEISLKKEDQIALQIFQDLVRKMKPKKAVIPLKQTQSQNWCNKTCQIF
ncbi:hypothetical protein ABPG74_015483 [Tetrahymena malaccensis]